MEQVVSTREEEEEAFDAVPEEYEDPILGGIMRDPVQLVSGEGGPPHLSSRSLGGRACWAGGCTITNPGLRTDLGGCRGSRVGSTEGETIHCGCEADASWGAA